MVILLVIRIDKRDKKILGKNIYNSMIWVTMIACLAEMVSFINDGMVFPGAVVLSYLMNSYCFIASGVAGYLWCIFVGYRLHSNTNRIRQRAKWIAIPLIVDVLLILINATGSGIIFDILDGNIYSRGPLVAITYVNLFFYYGYSVYIVLRHKKKNGQRNFMSVFCFILPCSVGTIIQGVFYGIAAGWTSVAISLVFVYLETQEKDKFIDSLSNLYNRRYMDFFLESIKRRCSTDVYGIMLDVNQFKLINDRYGHGKGDDAIRVIGRLLLEILPENGTAIRFAGDEFIVFLCTDDENQVHQFIQSVEEHTAKFNLLDNEPFDIKFSIGYSKMDKEADNDETFLSDMDKAMYQAKREYYQNNRIDRRRN